MQNTLCGRAGFLKQAQKHEERVNALNRDNLAEIQEHHTPSLLSLKGWIIFDIIIKVQTLSEYERTSTVGDRFLFKTVCPCG